MKYEPVVRFERNLAGRDFVVGDVHGCFSALADELRRIKFDPEFDRLFACGDLVDRGPESELVLEWLEKPWFHSVMGNHEDMALEYIMGNIPPQLLVRNGGAWLVATLEPDRWQYVDAFSALPIAIELETSGGTLGIVHSQCISSTWDEMVDALRSTKDGAWARSACMWGRERYELAVEQQIAYHIPGVKATIGGHTVVDNPLWLSNMLMIDTGACFKGGRFTIVDAETLKPV